MFDHRDRLTELLDELSKRVDAAVGKVGRITFVPHKITVSGEPDTWHSTKTTSFKVYDKEEMARDIATLASKVNEQQQQINKLNTQLTQVVNMLKKLTADLSDVNAADNFVDN